MFYVAGFVQGTGSSSGSNFTSTNLRDFGFAPAVGGSLSATVSATGISGTLSETGRSSVTFAGGPADVANYNYNTPANLIDIAGNWTFSLLTGETATVTVSAGGAAGGISSSGCQFSGTFTPSSDNKNVFDLTLTFGPSPCLLAGQSATGIALYTTIAGGQHQLIVAAVDGTRAYGTAGFGTR
ncbi:MAG: hypothetical protein ACOZJZ_07150 [Pseudomonadota bacterium]